MEQLKEKEMKMVNPRNRFKKFGGEKINDIIEYIKDYVAENPNVTISLGCDSVQRRKKTVYAFTLMFYSISIKNGAHVVYFRENITKIRDNNDRLSKEAIYIHEIAEWLDSEISKFFVRQDLTDSEQKRYKFHLAKCNGEFAHVRPENEDIVIQNLTLTDADKMQAKQFKSIDLHLDYNPFEGKIDNRGFAKNKSYTAFKAFTPWLKGLNYRVFAKPISPAAASAADLLLKN
jgi:predicted RNase H-related nuclease YkuK (DUF458 family)